MHYDYNILLEILSTIRIHQKDGSLETNIVANFNQ